MKSVSRRKKRNRKSSLWASLARRWWLILSLVLAVFCFLYVIFFSKIAGVGRFNFVVFTNQGDVGFVSLDSVEKNISFVEFPKELAIDSRSVGEYRIDRLEKLASYEEESGLFVKRKIQGFLRVPVSGYIYAKKDAKIKEVVRQAVFWKLLKRGEVVSDLSIFDLGLIAVRSRSYVEFNEGEKKLVKEGILVKKGDGYGYNRKRLSEFVGERYFDWLVGEEDVTVAVVDESGLPGLGEDVSDFVQNLGAKVVLVREEESERKESFLRVKNKKLKGSETIKAMNEFLGVGRVEVGKTESFRSEVVLFLGSDMEKLF